MRRLRRRSLLILAGVLGATTSIGCAPGRRPASYLPVGASAWYGDRTEDGVTLSLPLEARAAAAAVREALRATGYEVESPAGESRVVRTALRQLAGDTAVAITAEVIPLELPEPVSSIVLQATYSVPSRQVRDAPVLQRPGEVNPLYSRLRAVADTLRRSHSPAP